MCFVKKLENLKDISSSSNITDENLQKMELEHSNITPIKSPSNPQWMTHFGCSLQADNKSVRMSGNILSRSSTVSSSITRELFYFPTFPLIPPYNVCYDL